MSDDHGKKKDGEKPKDEKQGVSETTLDKLGLAADVIFGLFGHKIGNKIVDGIINVVTNKATKVHDRSNQLVSFGEAMTQLKVTDEHDYDLIRDFMRTSLTENADRNDFQVRTAQMGGDDVQVTVAFLQLLADEPDHQSRKNFLDEMGIIGERAIDPLERVQLVGKKIKKFFVNRGPQVWTDLDAGFAELNIQADEEGARLERELQTLLNAETPAARPAAGTGWTNRFSRAFNALRGR